MPVWFSGSFALKQAPETQNIGPNLTLDRRTDLDPRTCTCTTTAMAVIAPFTPPFVIRAIAYNTYTLTQRTRAKQPCPNGKDCRMLLDKVIYDSKGKSLTLSNIARAQHQSPKPSPMLRHSLPYNFNHRICISIFRSVGKVHV